MKEVSYKWNTKNLDSILNIHSKNEFIEETFLTENPNDCSGIKNGFYGKKHTKETKKIISKKIKNKCQTDEDFRKSRINIGEKNGMYGSKRFADLNPMWEKKHSKKTKLKQSEKKKEWYKNNQNPNKGKKLSDERKNQISEKNSKEYKLINPEGKIIQIKNLAKFAESNNLSIGCLYQVVSGRNKSHKGWKKYE
jgi:hypothetical protein